MTFLYLFKSKGGFLSKYTKIELRSAFYKKKKKESFFITFIFIMSSNLFFGILFYLEKRLIKTVSKIKNGSLMVSFSKVATPCKVSVFKKIILNFDSVRVY